MLLDRIVDWFAENGVLDTSMRTLAEGVGTSNRMLHYHFGSPPELLAAVVGRVCERERDLLRLQLAQHEDPFEAGRRYWSRLAATAKRFGPLFFELASHAMYGKPHADQLRSLLIDAWKEGFTEGFSRLTGPEHASTLAALSIAVGRGVLFDLALTGDDEAAEAVITEFTELVRHRVEGGSATR